MNRLNYTIIFVSDMSRSVAFYRDILGFPLRFESSKWSEFDTGSCTLALHRAGPGQVDPVGGENQPAGHNHPGIGVDDPDAFHRKMLAAGVPCLREPKMEEFGAKLAVYADPDGLPISVIGPMPQ